MSSTASPTETPSAGQDRAMWRSVVRVLAVVAVPVAIVFLFGQTFDYLRDDDANRVLLVLVALGVGVVGVFAVYWAMNAVVDLLPLRAREHVRPWVFVGPALLLLGVFLLYPLIDTFLTSFKDARLQNFVGADNYRFILGDEDMLLAIRNTFGWILLVPLFSVTIGLAYATLVDRLRVGESVAKSLVFLPMAISFVGASVTWKLIYGFRPEGFGSNIGLLNGIMLAFGAEPVSWLDIKPWNNVFLMVIMIWMQTGFAMVVLSAAIKAIPDEIVEAARIDGASEWQVFRQILIPSILPTVVVVTTYMVITALKVFDIVFVLGSAENDGTVVIAERMIRWGFIYNHRGRGAAIAMFLFIAIIPVMVWNIRRFREEEAIR
jgi:alpha-glucoside transport system permease protein